MTTVTESQVMEVLGQITEPDLNRDLVSLNMIKDVKVEGNAVSFTIALTRPAPSLKSQLQEQATKAVKAIPGVEKIDINFSNRIPGDPRLMTKKNIGVRNAIAVASGKGGVGKSTLATNLALSLALDGASVGLLDVDIYGPNIPLMMGAEGRPKGRDNKILPPEAHGIKLMSMGFLIDPNQAVIWRGPMIHNAIRQFIEDVDWGDLDYLVIDLPPGTGDASLSLAQNLGLTGAMIVTTPQKVALSDVIRSVAMFEQLNVPILGVVENMSFFVAPDTGKRYDIFGHGGGAEMAKEVGVNFLGEVPLESEVRVGGDEGQPIVVRDPESPAAQAIRTVARKVAAVVAAQNLTGDSPQSKRDPVISILN